ncbi:MAG: hypothetical protein GOP50_13465 [Candidatus Heimdallarchaeota archaeon]|nr:hypothetical protein [Candidatus Heimdallarchaeota archaeon]
MKLTWKIITGVLIGSIILTAIFVPLKYLVWDKPESNGLVDHDPILIWSDDDFVEYGLPGNGSMENPYRIEYLNITTSDVYSVYISSTTKCFTIASNFIANNNENGLSICIDNIEEGTALICNNTINARNTGLNILFSDNNIVTNNTFSNCFITINIYGSDGNRVFKNIFLQPIKDELLTWSCRVRLSSFTNFSQNEVFHSDVSFFLSFSRAPESVVDGNVLNNVFLLLEQSENSTISKNVGNECNLNIYSSFNCLIDANEVSNLYVGSNFNTTISNNYLNEIGISFHTIEDYYDYTFENNWINNKQLAFFLYDNDSFFNEALENYGQIYFLGCNNVTISAPSIDNEILLLNFIYCDNITIIKNNLKLQVKLRKTDNVLIQQNSDLKIYTTFSENITIIDNMSFDTYFELTEVDYVTIENNFLSNSTLNVKFCSHVDILNNTISGKDLYCYDNEYLLIDNNHIADTEKGLWIEAIRYSNITNNNLDNIFGEGVLLGQFYGSSFINNTLTNCQQGVFLRESHSLSTYENLVFENNYVNGKPIGYFMNLNDTIFNSDLYAQLIFVNCTNLIIEDLTLTNSSVCLQTVYGYNITIENISCSNSLYGIYAAYTDYLQIINCESNNAIMYGLYVFHCDFSNIFDNILYNNYIGLHLQLSDFSNVENNILTENPDGLYIYASFNCTINLNQISDGFSGIDLIASDYCNVSYNLVTDCQSWGIYLHSSSEYNRIHHNSLINNSWGNLIPESTSQGYDDGEYNLWYDVTTLEGNYYDDLTGSDGYEIDGLAENSDPYPLSSNPL